MSSKASALLKCLLQHEPWQDTFSFTLEGFREEDKELQKAVNTFLASMDRSVLLSVCTE